jgi:uncharacterized protein (TIGR03086 family)
MNPTPAQPNDASIDDDLDVDAIVADYRRSLDVMDAAVRSADPDRWDDQSPCEHWSARQVLGHAVTFAGNVVTLAGDGPAPDFHATVDFAAVAGDDPTTTWTAIRERIEAELLGRPDRLAAVRMTPLGVEMPIAQLLTFQGMDPVVHGWDIATATGGRVDIPDDLADKYVARFAPVAESIRANGLLGPTTDGGTSPLDRLLDFCGRIR